MTDTPKSSHVFISYKREDEARAARIAAALEKVGLEVWWDRGLPSGESWHANIEAKLDTAGCVIVVWSQASLALQGNYVRDEARRGLARGILVPVTVDKIKQIPLGFGEIQAIDLSHWRGDTRDAFFLDLVAAVRAKIEGRDAPKPVGPTKRIARRLAMGGASTAGIAALAAVAFNAFGLSAKMCTLPASQPALSDACGAVGLGDRPSRTERLAWASLPPGSCPALREHIARFPQGAYRSEAADLLTARRVSTGDAWTPVTRQLAQFEAADGPSAPNESAARTAALGRAQAQADHLCQGFGSGSLYRFVAATARADTWRCSTSGAGFVCGFDGHAECALQQHSQVERESCGPKA